MVLTVTEDTPADMLAGSMELLVQLPRDHHLHTQRVTVLRNTPMMDLLVQITTAHKLAASSYTLQAIGERGLVLPHHPNTPIGTLDALQVKLLPKQGTCASRKTKQTNQPFETTFRLQVHLPRNQLYVSRVSPKMNLGEILDEVCREKNLDRSKYELRHPTNLEETLDLSLSLQDYHLQEVTLYAKQTRSLGPTLSTQDIMALQRQEERRRQQTKQSVFGFMFKKSKESSLSTDSLRGRSVSPARSDETTRSASPLQPPARPQRKRRPAPKPPSESVPTIRDKTSRDSSKDKMVINHSRNSSDSSGYHEASVLSDNPDLNARLPETLPRRSKVPGISDIPRKLAQTSQSSKSLGNLAAMGGTLSRGISSTSLSSTGLRKKRAAPPPPTPRPLSSAISTQALERIIDSEESLTSDMDPSKPPSDIGAPSKTNSDIECPKANSDIGVTTQSIHHLDYKPKLEAARYESDNNIQQNHAAKTNIEARLRSGSVNSKLAKTDTKVMTSVEVAPRVEQARVAVKRGKLTRSANNLNVLSRNYKTRYLSKNPYHVGEDTDANKISRATSYPGKHNLLISQRYRSQHDNSINGNLANNISVGVVAKDHIRDITGQVPQSCQKFQFKPESCENHKESISFDSHEFRANRSSKSINYSKHYTKEHHMNKQLKMQMLVDPEGIKSETENVKCGVLESRYNPECHKKVLAHSTSFQNSITSKGIKLASSFEKPNLFSSRSLDSKYCKTPSLLESAVHSVKLGKINTTKCHTSSIVSSENREPYNSSEQYAERNLSPPPLSTLQIFAISTKPLDIQMAPTDSIPSDIDELPSLPIIKHTENKLEEIKLSILKPPPAGLVSRHESNESWNRFLVQLNSILESRAGEFV